MTACVLLACATTETPTPSPANPTIGPTATPPSTPADDQPSETPPPPTPTAPASPTRGAGFAFVADDVLGYYEGLGYECTDWRPSTTAADFSYRSCASVDGDGRTLVIGVVVDPDGELANGFASVEAAAGQTSLAPIDALEPLAGFLGAMLGEERGAAILTWFATHLGDEYAETPDGALRVATYTDLEGEAPRIYVEVANQTYLDAPGVDGE